MKPINKQKKPFNVKKKVAEQNNEKLAGRLFEKVWAIQWADVFC